MSILFVVATKQEWHAAAPEPSALLPQEYIEQDIHTFTGNNGKKYGVLITGVGPVNAAIAIGKHLDYAQHATAVINIGLAGSFDLNKAPLCSHWRVVREIYPEYGLATDTTIDAQALGFAQWNGTPQVWNSVALPNISHIEALVASLPLNGTTESITVAGVSACQERAARLYATHSTALLENMEGFSLALACARHPFPLLEVRTVSNLVGSRAPKHRDFVSALVSMRSLVEQILL